MADRSVATTDTLAVFRREVNSTAADIGDIADILSASGFIASSTDIVESIVAVNSELPEITTDAFVFPSGSMIFEGATADAFETTLAITDPTADRTFTFPDATSSVLVREATQTLTNKTLTTPTITSGVLNTSVSGTAFLDEDNMASDSATKAASQQSIVAYADSIIGTLPINSDSGNISIGTGSETLTIAGGTGIDSVGSGNSLTLNIDSTVATLVGTETFTNKTLTSPTLTSSVLNTAVSGSAVLDEDNMASDSATKVATQQSIKAYVDDSIDADMDLVFAADSGGSLNIVMDSESLTLTGGTGITTSGSSNTVTFTTNNTVATLTGSETLTNKTFTSPTLNEFTFTGTNSSLGIGSGGIIFEGSSADANESLLTVVDPSQDNTITLPDASGDIITDTTNPRDTKAFLFSILMAMG
jgi:hypothetical protein